MRPEKTIYQIGLWHSAYGLPPESVCKELGTSASGALKLKWLRLVDCGAGGLELLS